MYAIRSYYVNGHLLYKISDDVYRSSYNWLKDMGLLALIDDNISAYKSGKKNDIEKTLDECVTKFVEKWEIESGLMTFSARITSYNVCYTKLLRKRTFTV